MAEKPDSSKSPLAPPPSAGPDTRLFLDPPISARPGAFWNWLNGNVDRERLVYELREMKEKGMSGAEIWDVAAIRQPEFVPAGPEFLGPESVDAIRFALAEARKLGLRMGMITSSGWNAGGTWVDPSWASKILVHSTAEATGPAMLELPLPFPEVPKECPLGPDGKPVYYREVAALAVPASSDQLVTGADKPEDRIVDLSGKLGKDGVLRWEVPAGEWRILRFVCTNTGQVLIVPSPKSKGLFIDFLDPEATRRHLQLILDRLQITPANAAEVGLSYLEVDSMELHEGNPWTDKFPDWFRKQHGYDLVQYLPVLAGWTIGDKETSERFLYDYRKTVSDLLIHSHYETGSKFLEQYGIEFVGEAGGPGPPVWKTCPVDALKALGNVHVPRGEFWIQHRNMFLIKEIASASHIYGKPIVDAESFTTWRRWEDSPFVLKKSADRAFAEGLNRLTIHGFAHSPESAGLPGRTYHAGIDINPNTTWWPFARPFMDYLARCSYMLQQGRPVGDVLWYYGDKAPNFFPEIHNVPEKPRLPGLSRGYDYDVVNSDVILKRLRVENGRFVLPEGTSYAVLAFPENVTMPLEVMEKIESLVREGGVVCGKPPETVPGLRDHQERTRKLQEAASRIWGDQAASSPHRIGQGKAYRGLTLDEVLKAEGITPDFSAEEGVDYIHRSTADAEIYFVRNMADEAREVEAVFRVSGKTPEMWDPSTGAVRPCRTFRAEESAVTVGLDLEPGGATFVVFNDRPKGTGGADADERIVQTLEPSTSWTLSFPPGWGAPTGVDVSELKSWTDFKDPGIRYFSGTGEYRTQLTPSVDVLASTGTIMLDLGVVHDVAEVKLNGCPAGIAWKPPYRVDVTGLLREGANNLVVRVTNQWHNRRVGDADGIGGRRFTNSNQPLLKKGEAQPLRAGMEGPVRFLAR